MRAIHDFIISTETRYNNSVDVEGKELIVNTEITERDAQFVNRLATITAVPSARKTNLKVGDQVIVHHNVFRRWYDIRGKEKNGAAYIDDDTYIVSEDQVFAYKRDDEWKACLRYCFVKPIVDDSEWREDRHKQLIGELLYTDEHLDSLGIKPGTIVGFTPESEYEFTIDDQLLYRIYSTQITIDYGLQKRKATDYSVISVGIESAG